MYFLLKNLVAIFVFIDGRYRVACGIFALKLLKPLTGLIGIHDYKARDKYHVLEEFYEVVEKVDKSAIMRARLIQTEFKEMEQKLHKYLAIPT